MIAENFHNISFDEVLMLWEKLDIASSLLGQIQLSKLAVARLPKTTKTLIEQPVFMKNKGLVAREKFAGQPRKKLKY